jgi:hypothetical protein
MYLNGFNYKISISNPLDSIIVLTNVCKKYKKVHNFNRLGRKNRVKIIMSIN